LRPPRANLYRDAWAGELDAARVGENVRVAGWVHSRRDHGGVIFIDLRDRSGIVQLTFHPESPAFPLAEKLRHMGAVVRFHDPHVAVWTAEELGEGAEYLTVEPDLRRAAEGADVVVLLQAHRQYLDGALDGVPVFDTRGVLDGPAVERL
jgi:hypothetical protein